MEEKAYKESWPSPGCTMEDITPQGVDVWGPAIPPPYLFDLPWLLHGEVEQFSSSYFHVIRVEDADLLRIGIPDQRGLFPKPFPHLQKDRDVSQ